MSDFFLFAGPNGSGKSTIISIFLNDIDVIYLNADYCARVDPDIESMSEGIEKSIRAQKETERQIYAIISSGLSLAWETVFSHESRLEIMEYAKKKGYTIHLIYITTKDPDINVARVRARVYQGGHDVPEEKIRARYGRSISFLPQMILASDEVQIYDNSYENMDPQLLFQKILPGNNDFGPQMIAWNIDDNEITEWVMEYVIYPLETIGYSIPCYSMM